MSLFQREDTETIDADEATYTPAERRTHELLEVMMLDIRFLRNWATVGIVLIVIAFSASMFAS